MTRGTEETAEDAMRAAEVRGREAQAEIDRLRRELHDRLQREQRVSIHDLRPALLAASERFYRLYWRAVTFADGAPQLHYADLAALLARECFDDDSWDDAEELLREMHTEHREIVHQKREQAMSGGR